LKSFLRHLQELFISPNNGAKYGQVIFLVGGAAAGKSTAIKQYIDAGSYKVLNPDDVKALIVKAATKGIPAFRELQGVDPNTPEGSQKVHKFILKTKISSKKAKLLTSPSRGKETKYLPNIMYDRTFSFAGEFKKISQNLIRAGYKAKNIHTIFVFTDVNIALKRNRERARTLPDDVIVQSATGAKARFSELFFGRAKGAMTNGDWYIVFDRGKSSLQVKRAGQRPEKVGKMALKVAEILGLKQ